MSCSSAQHNNPAPLTSQTQLASLMSLPHELAHLILGLIRNFVPRISLSMPENEDATIADEELTLHSREAMPLNMTCINRYILGLSSESDWLILTLSRHPYHLQRSKRDGISPAVTQALRRANARFERMQWEGRESRRCLQIHEDSNTADFTDSHFTKWDDSPADDDTLGQKLRRESMAKYHACVQPEEDVYLEQELEERQVSVSQDTVAASPPATALILYDPAPVLKLTESDVSELASRLELSKATRQLSALLAAVLVTLIQCRLSVLEALEKLEHDTAVPTIEPCEIKDFATSKMSPGHDRPRSLSGSTVADVQSREESLSFSAVSTVYSSENSTKRVQWEGRDKELVSPKRPKLSQYKQVSSGRVATLMDRFEKFHL
ncbi:hypothetical protein EKO04_006337 [Ascochyta lentis]|uniref:Uncharacterized protein n=1 Tax=Ascochyta lentis TaxID=205686 RepID=A0A8H7MI03_9PLEO|nr:hypothetical protein EKO04_006337 [Ascochyta lentis]